MNLFWHTAIERYVDTHCVARGLASRSRAAYRDTLKQFSEWIRIRRSDAPPDAVRVRDVLEYLQHLREERCNGDAAVNRQVTILRSFYRALVAMELLEPRENPLAHFPRIKAVARKLPETLSQEEIARLLAAPPTSTEVGVRDRTLLALLYATGIRASECAQLTVRQVDLAAALIHVRGKGGHERTIPLNEEVVARLRCYVSVRGPALPAAPFFRSRLGHAMSRGTLYERVRFWARKARIAKRISPHQLRHTFATHLVAEGVGLVTIRDLLGHRLITSTQIYLHVTAQDLRKAAKLHPISRLLGTIEQFLPNVRLPFQKPGARCASA
jgi:integrase/recombinase XerD